VRSPRAAEQFSQRWALALTIGAAGGALALLWRVRAGPLVLGAVARIDALSAFFILATLAGIALRGWRPGTTGGGRHDLSAAMLLILAFTTTFTFSIALCFVLGAMLDLWQRREGARGLPAASVPEEPGAPRENRQSSKAGTLVRFGALSRPPGAFLRALTRAAAGPLAAAMLVLGYGLLVGRGALQYDQPAAGAALDSWVFWLVLLAAAIGATPIFASGDVLQIAWLYPLTRLYSLGPWNAGWSYAAILLGGAAACWCAVSALAQADRHTRAARSAAAYVGLALAGLGLGTSAGLVAGCYAMLAYLVLISAAARADAEKATPPQADKEQPAPFRARSAYLPAWLASLFLTAAFPLTTPFIAAWMLMGAGVAGGVALLAGVAWLVALLNALSLALWGAPPPEAHRSLYAPAAASAILGIGAPLAVLGLIQPLVDQLQGGLTPYGEVNIWPWVGLATSDAAHTQVTTLPSIAIAMLMLVLCALIYVVARLREVYGRRPPGAVPAAASHDAAAIVRTLRDDVPWLAGLLGADRPDERRHGEPE
jgi:hypothetical protein